MKLTYFPKLLGNIPVVWALATSADEFRELQLRGNVPEEHRDYWPDFSGSRGATTHWYDRLVIVCAPLDTPDGYLVHEAVHVYQATMKQIGEDDAGLEIQAYCIQFIAETLIAEFTRIRADKGNKAKARVLTKAKKPR